MGTLSLERVPMDANWVFVYPIDVGVENERMMGTWVFVRWVVVLATRVLKVDEIS